MTTSRCVAVEVERALSVRRRVMGAICTNDGELTFSESERATARDETMDAAATNDVDAWKTN